MLNKGDKKCTVNQTKNKIILIKRLKIDENAILNFFCFCPLTELLLIISFILFFFLVTDHPLMSFCFFLYLLSFFFYLSFLLFNLTCNVHVHEYKHVHVTQCTCTEFNHYWHAIWLDFDLPFCECVVSGVKCKRFEFFKHFFFAFCYTMNKWHK